MRILIFDGRFPSSHAKELAERLRSDGHNVGFRNAGRFTGNVERLAGRVYADSDEVRAAYEAAGTSVQHLTSGSARDDVSAYHVGNGWYEVDGEKVRGKDAARALLAGGE